MSQIKQHSLCEKICSIPAWNEAKLGLLPEGRLKIGNLHTETDVSLRYVVCMYSQSIHWAFNLGTVAIDYVASRLHKK